ncbi:hypothetical protein QJS04_geneDACA019296 [Acorus gramineus]|uniref:Uncharacterized protein n=1 Tax=Acorus gramineus TaxID=55184 RepID=A0AAV9A3H3_ACOGR|nr:hypothetical protein QJS04_geneDACA019296 [Acorus gramineus]
MTFFNLSLTKACFISCSTVHLYFGSLAKHLLIKSFPTSKSSPGIFGTLQKPYLEDRQHGVQLVGPRRASGGHHDYRASERPHVYRRTMLLPLSDFRRRVCWHLGEWLKIIFRITQSCASEISNLGRESTSIVQFLLKEEIRSFNVVVHNSRGVEVIEPPEHIRDVLADVAPVEVVLRVSDLVGDCAKGDILHKEIVDRGASIVEGDLLTKRGDNAGTGDGGEDPVLPMEVAGEGEVRGLDGKEGAGPEEIRRWRSF